MKPKIVVVGSSNTDMAMQVTAFPVAGETVMGKEFVMNQGGKGANQAVCAARLGASVTFVTRLGRDAFGEEAFAAFQTEGINTDYIVWDDKTHTGVALILINKDAENTIAVAANANNRLTREDVCNAEEKINDADCVLVQLEIPVEAVDMAVELAHRHGTYVILNPAPFSFIAPHILEKVDVLTPNETEMASLAKIVDIPYRLENLQQIRKGIGVRQLLMTQGSKGACIVSEDITHIPAYSVNAVDTTAAGDAFNGGLAVALASGKGMREAATYACAVAALTTLKIGAQASLPTFHDVREFLLNN